MIWRKPTPEPEEPVRPRGFDDYELRIGDLLRGERATLGKSLLDVQKELHIRAAFIAAIENGDLSVFESPTIVPGLVRAYARYLGMDQEWVYARFCEETGFRIGPDLALAPEKAASTRRKPLVAPAGPEKVELRLPGIAPLREPFWQRLEPGALASLFVLAALITGFGVLGWTVLQEVQRVQVAPVDVSPTVVANLDPLAGVVQNTDPALAEMDPVAFPAGRASGTVRLLRPQALDVPVLAPRDGPIAAIPPEAVTDEALAASPRPAATEAAVAEALAGSPAEEGAISTVQVTADSEPEVKLLAVRPAWVRVRAADGTIIFERILDAGETWTVPATEAPPTLHAGNTGAVYFLIGNQAYGPAAPGANVVRNVVLSAEALGARYGLADLSRDRDLSVHVARLLTTAD